MVASRLIIEAADPASAILITPKTAEHTVNLNDQFCCVAAISLVACSLEELKEIADRKCIRPKIPSRILYSRQKARSPSKGSHEPSHGCRFMFRRHTAEDNYSPEG
jgi:hypothetical protein